MNEQLSSLRSQLLQAQQRLPQLLEECLGREPLLPGSLYTLRRKCGKPNCRCSRGELHEGTVLCEGPVDRVQQDERVMEVYLGRSRDSQPEHA